jgi:myo-inositol-1(or 4)-monophosphatase
MGSMSPAEDAANAVDPWLAACRRIVAAQAELFRSRTGITARTEYAGVGEGGDRSLVIDREAEEIAFAELERLHGEGLQFTAISEERGEVAFGNGSDPRRVVIDPIDGSLNARRTLPSFCFSLAVASGPSMADVDFGFIHDFGSGEEFGAVRGQGARLNGDELLARGPGYGLELVGIEMAKPELILPLIDGLVGKAYRIRAIGSLALTLCYVAGGRLDGMVGARAARSVDVAAAQLIAREAGASVRFEGIELDDAQLDLDARYVVVAGLDEEMLGTLLAIQRDAVPVEP